MVLTNIDIPEEQNKKLIQKAKQQGISKNQYIKQTLLQSINENE